MSENFTRTTREKKTGNNEFLNTIFVQSCICITIAIIFVFLNTFSKSSYDCAKQKYKETMLQKDDLVSFVSDFKQKAVAVFKNIKPLSSTEK